jgi:hypothetical protein
MGCGHVKRAAGALTGNTPNNQPPEIPDQLKARDNTGPTPLTRVSLDGEGVPVGQGSAADFPGGIPSEDQIVWTDPDNPDAPLEGLEETLATKRSQSGGWEISYTEATRLAVREGKPIMIWFTDTLRSPLCRSLSAEVFSDATFDSWAREKLVRLRIDFNVRGETEDETLRKKDYVEGLKKRYKVGGLPTVILMAPDGTVTGRWKGYKRDQGDFYFGRIKNATRTAEMQLEKWHTSMGKKGYRTWKNRKGKQIFAKLLRYKDQELILVEPNGNKFKARERQLSDEDQAWIQAELAKRAQ